jgi:pilus assembly protein FimV
MAQVREKVIQAAERLVARGKVEAAIKEYRKVLTENPRDTNTLNRVGDLYARIERIDDAVALFTRIAEHYTEDGFFVKAIAIYKKIIKLDPTRLEIYERLAELYHRQGLVNEARTQYQVLVDYYQKHGQAERAISVCQRMLALEPANPSHRARLADLLEQQGRIAEAIAEYRAIAGEMLQSGQAEGAARVYEKAVEIDSEDLDLLREALDRLRGAGASAAAARILAAASLRNPRAEALLRQHGRPEAVEPEPVAPSAFEGIPAGLAGTVAEDADIPFELTGDEVLVLDLDDDEEPASQVKPPPEFAPVPPAALIRTEKVELDESEFELSLSLDLEEEEVPLGKGPEPTAPPTEIFVEEDAFDLLLDADALEQTAAELMPQVQQQEDDLVAEAEVFSKYGLRARALERLNEVFRVNPQHLGAYALQIQLYLEEGRHDRVTFLANEMAAIAADTGRLAVWEPVRDRLLESGYRLDGPRRLSPPPSAAAGLPAAEPVATEARQPAAEAAEPDWVELEIDELELPSIELDESAFSGLADVSIAPPAEPEPASFGVEEELDGFDLPLVEIEDPAEERSAPALGALQPFEAESVAPALELGDEIVEVVAPAPAPEPAPEPPPRRRRSDIDLDLDQTMAQLSGLLGGARSSRRRVEGTPPAPAVPSAAPAPAAVAPPVAPPPAVAPAAPAASMPSLFSGSDLLADLESEGLEAQARPARPAAPPAAQPVPPAAAPVEATGWLDELEGKKAAGEVADVDGLFDDEQQFFDLAAELEEELRNEESMGGDDLFAQPHEQTLEEIVEGFKRGVAENLSPEDYDTHFNLGIAYREMGLIDEAIGEFQLASKTPDRFVDCCSMLGLCFQEKGLPELAVKWYRKALELGGLTEDESLALQYDLGNAQALAGDRDSAYRTFVEIYGTNSHYRDVVARLEELAP